MTKLVHVYAGGPLDFWGGWQNTTDVLTYERTDLRLPPGLKIDRDDFTPFIYSAKEIAHEMGWEGDMREGPYVSVLPDGEGGRSLFLVGFKQDNNGTTFIGSEVELPHLKAAGWSYMAGEIKQPKAQ